MWVLKIGGSLADAETLPSWLEVAACYGCGRVVIVPGGGPFADQVRQAQQYWQYPDTVAHRMALLAMEQYGLMLSGLRPDLAPVAHESELIEALAQARVPVWLPSASVLAADDVPHSWEVTSDSLAAWLARRLGAAQLVLVKSLAPTEPRMAAERLQREGIVDRAFARYLQDDRFVTVILGKDCHELFKQMLNGGGASGTLVCAGSA